MNRIIKSLGIGLIGGPILVVVYSFPAIFTDTRTTLHLMFAGAAAGSVGFVLLGIFQNASFWLNTLIAVLAGALAGLTFGLMRPDDYSLITCVLLGSVLLPCFIFLDSGFNSKQKTKAPPAPNP